MIKLYLRRGQNKDPRSEQIGDMYNFSAPGKNDSGEVCSNCVQQEASGLRCRAQFTLSDLKAYFKAVDSTLDTDDEDSIESFLKERIYVMVYAVSCTFTCSLIHFIWLTSKKRLLVVLLRFNLERTASKHLSKWRSLRPAYNIAKMRQNPAILTDSKHSRS